MAQLAWGHSRLTLTLGWGDDTPLHLVSATTRSTVVEHSHVVPLVEILTAAIGHVPATSRLSHTRIGHSLRYVSHATTEESGVLGLDVHVAAADLGISAVLHLELHDASAALTSSVTVTAVGTRHLLRSVPSWSSVLGSLTETSPDEDAVAVWSLLRGEGQWLGEGRWTTVPVRDAGLPELRLDIPGWDARSAVACRSFGSWSTSGPLPVGGAVRLDAAWLWQIEHNGAWRWEIGEDLGGLSVTLSGPTDDDHNWSLALEDGESFTSVPITVALGADLAGAAAELTGNRRARRRDHEDNTAMSVVFNDYMNTLDGDPTTEKLLPLIEAAASAGAEIFCIDAGWYDDGGDWWPSVGEWRPSTTRFPGGLGEVVTHIRELGMVPGLWLEPEVIGVSSPLARSLPDAAFLQRGGFRVEEHDRFHLDLRHPAAIAHLDSTVDRLVEEFGVGFFKLDYNINAGPGTDLDATSPGDGLLQHNRAHLAWLDSVLDRHPGLVIENCGSGGQRMDFAMLSRLQMQSTSDQQDFRLYPPIAATAALSMLPEQAANWAYPQPEMNQEEIAFCLVTGLLGRFYLSGYLNNMTPEQLALVHEAVAVAKGVRAEIVEGTPGWPLGLPRWADEVVVAALETPQSTLVSLWVQNGASEVRIPMPSLLGRHVQVETIFPRNLPEWSTEWDSAGGVLTIRTTSAPLAARTIRITPQH